MRQKIRKPVGDDAVHDRANRRNQRPDDAVPLPCLTDVEFGGYVKQFISVSLVMHMFEYPPESQEDLDRHDVLSELRVQKR